jgi:hypothetical protein
VELLTELGTQVFATTTSPDHLGQLPSEDTRYVEVESGLLRLSVSSLDQRRSPDNNGEVDPPDAT